MTTRLMHLEQRLNQQERQLAAKDKKIDILEDKVQLLKKARDEAGSSRCQELEQKCSKLQEQIKSMETFLSDYGMVWIGEDSGETASNAGSDQASLSESGTVWRPDDSVSSDQFTIDFNLIRKNIEELNVLAGEGVGRVQRTVDGGRLKMPKSLSLVLYANGIVLDGSPFRPVSDPATRQILLDLMDGFFPSELQSAYPDGVPFTVTDRREVQYTDQASEYFSGAGQILGGETRPSRLLQSNVRERSSQHRIRHTSGHSLDAPSATAARSLPPVASPGRAPVETSSQTDMTTEDSTTIPEGAPSATPTLTTLRLKVEGGKTYVVKMKVTDTVGDIRHYLRSRVRWAEYYTILSTFPSQTYTNNKATLEECGLVPSATLHIRRPRKK